MVQNKGLIFTEIPSGVPQPGKHLQIKDRPIDLDSVEIPQDGLLLKNHYVSYDPYQRGRMRDPSVKSYAPPYKIGDPLMNSTICTVVRSNNSKFSKDDMVACYMSGYTEEYSIIPGQTVNATVSKLQNPHNLDPKLFIGVLGMPGLTAYGSLYGIGEPKKGETIFISAASGAVGAMVGQLCKRDGLKVIGSVGDDKKLEYITKELGFDGGFNYKSEKPADALARLAPEGLDLYYENVGGEQLEAAIGAMKDHGRIIACGMVSQYNKQPSEAYGVRNLMQIVAKRLKIQGFIINDHLGPRYREEHQRNVQQWLADGSLKASMSETQGIDQAAEGFVGMLEGKNFGKAILTIDPLK